MKEYKNTGKTDLTFVGHPTVQPGAVIRTESPISHPDMELLSDTSENKQPNSVVGTEVQQPNVVTNAAPVINPVGEPTQGVN